MKLFVTLALLLLSNNIFSSDIPQHNAPTNQPQLTSLLSGYFEDGSQNFPSGFCYKWLLDFAPRRVNGLYINPNNFGDTHNQVLQQPSQQGEGMLGSEDAIPTIEKNN